MTSLAGAANQGNEQVVDVLLKAGANPDIQNHIRFTALMMASKKDHRGVVKALLERKADTSIADKVGWCL